MQCEEELKLGLAAYRDIKQHYWTEHAADVSPPMMMVWFRERGAIPLPLKMIDSSMATPDVAVEWLLRGASLHPKNLMTYADIHKVDERLMAFATLGCLAAKVEGEPFDGDDRIETVWITVDTYVNTAEEGVDDYDGIGGQGLERSFKSDPASTVSEAIVLMAYTDDLVGGVDHTEVLHMYSKSDGGGITWNPRVHAREFQHITEGNEVTMAVLKVMAEVNQ